MTTTRREFLTVAAGGLGAAAIPGTETPAGERPTQRPPTDQFDPWLEVDPQAIRHNVETVARLVGGRPILAVAKNNAYGLGIEIAGPMLDRLPQIAGLAVVRADEAFRLRGARVRKPVLLMGRCDPSEAVALARLDVSLAASDDADAAGLARAAARAMRRVTTHLYVDTGMSRMGLPWQRAVAWARGFAAERPLRIGGMFTELTEDPDFDREQVRRLETIAGALKSAGIAVGQLHAASSDAVMGLPETFLDLVRPGIALYGGYPNEQSRATNSLRCAFRLKARVVRVEHLDAGEGVNYHRRWRATQPTWVATLAIGHVDGYPSGAGKGAEVLIGDRLHRVIGGVSASHTIVEVGSEATVRVGDVATLVGPDRPELHPNEIASRAQYGGYDMFMHLSPGLRRVVVS